jgi:hypothetical protein
MLQNNPIKLPPFDFDTDPEQDPAFYFDADPELAFHFDTDPDPASQSDMDPRGSGSAALPFSEVGGICWFWIRIDSDRTPTSELRTYS